MYHDAAPDYDTRDRRVVVSLRRVSTTRDSKDDEKDASDGEDLLGAHPGSQVHPLG
jgi:hypothetical protein